MRKIFNFCVIAFVLVIVTTSFSNKVEARVMFSSGQYYEVRLNSDLLSQRGRCYVQAKVKLNIYKADGKLNNWRGVRVTMRDQYNNVIWEGNHSGGNLNLGNDHDIYRIYVRDPKYRQHPPLADCWQWEIVPVSGCASCDLRG